ncbi:MAG: ribosome small subunit-dependent GTPase A [Ktedonobacterales bacterium]
MAEPAKGDHIATEDGGASRISPPNPAREPDHTSAKDGEEGVVIAISKGYFEVSDGNRMTLCTLRGKLRATRPQPTHRIPAGSRSQRGGPPAKRTRSPIAETSESAPIRIAPGDHVRYRVIVSNTGVIEEVYPRQTALARARSESATEHIMLANLDHAVLVFAVRNPTPHFGMLDRYLALCEHAGIAVTICLNKVDLAIPDEVDVAVSLYVGLGYRVLMTSAATGAGVDALRALLTERVSLLTGPSGVGKSSLLNELIPEAGQRIAEISEATGKGRHTTTGARLLALPGGGWLADSAGIRELALWNVPAQELASAFVELRPYADQCEYENCEHAPADEGCALQRALAAGEITPERFAGFERLLREAREAEEQGWQ